MDEKQLKRLAKEQRDAKAQYNLGVIYAKGDGVEKDYGEAVKWYTKAAEQGHASGQNNLGVMYAKSDGVVQDYRETLKWYTKAAQQGFPPRTVRPWLDLWCWLGRFPRLCEAHKWFNLAAAQGLEDAAKRVIWWQKR